MEDFCPDINTEPRLPSNYERRDAAYKQRAKLLVAIRELTAAMRDRGSPDLGDDAKDEPEDDDAALAKSLAVSCAEEAGWGVPSTKEILDAKIRAIHKANIDLKALCGAARAMFFEPNVQTLQCATRHIDKLAHSIIDYLT